MMPRQPETNENETGPETPGSDMDILETGDAAQLKQALAEEREKSGQYLASWQRAQADFANYKRRVEQEKDDLRKFANSTIMLGIISVLDDFKRAVTSVPSEIENEAWVEGIKLIERKLVSAMEAQGLATIDALGKKFDPHLHEAVREGRGKEGEVIEEVLKGYTLHDRVIRPSQVVVGNGEKQQ